jgi:membrane associated rhomboid family serine protease
MAMGFIGLIGLFSGFTGFQPGIGHFAHVGGAMLGFLMSSLSGKWLICVNFIYNYVQVNSTRRKIIF